MQIDRWARWARWQWWRDWKELYLQVSLLVSPFFQSSKHYLLPLLMGVRLSFSRCLHTFWPALCVRIGIYLNMFSRHELLASRLPYSVFFRVSLPSASPFSIFFVFCCKKKTPPPSTNTLIHLVHLRLGLAFLWPAIRSCHAPLLNPLFMLGSAFIVRC